jgi:hypothetical protein
MKDSQVRAGGIGTNDKPYATADNPVKIQIRCILILVDIALLALLAHRILLNNNRSG